MNDATPTAALVAALTDELPAVLLIASALALPGSAGLLVWLRRALSRARAPQSEAHADANHGGVLALRSATASSFAIADLRDEPCPREIIAAGRDAWMRPWQSALVHAIAGAVFAAITTLAWRFGNHDTSLRLAPIALLFWTFFWPAVIAVNLVAGTTPATQRGTAAAYFAVLAAIAAFGLARNPDLAWRELTVLWLLVNASTTAVLALFFTRRLRAVGPLVFALAVTAAAATQLTLGSGAAFATRLAVAALVAATVVWPLLFAIGALHARREVCDRQLLVASVWLSFGAVYALASGGAGSLRCAGIAAACAGALITTRVGHDVVRRVRHATQPKRLLLLRAATASARSEALFDALSRHWSQVGSVTRIANGVALETRDLLDFVGGRYAADETLRERAAQSDVALVDLRRFGRPRIESVAELAALLDATDLARVVFVVADAIDAAHLEALLDDCWKGLAPDSPNRKPGPHVARLVGDPGHSPAALRALLGVLAS